MSQERWSRALYFPRFRRHLTSPSFVKPPLCPFMSSCALLLWSVSLYTTVKMGLDDNWSIPGLPSTVSLLYAYLAANTHMDQEARYI